MSVPVEFHTLTPEDRRLDLQRRIASAPREHAEAVLESYGLLQRLHDAGIRQSPLQACVAPIRCEEQLRQVHWRRHL